MDQKSPITRKLMAYGHVAQDLEAIENQAADILDELAAAREDMKELAAVLGITQPAEVVS